MPLPKPRENEKQKDFIERCVIDPNVIKESKDLKQRLGICYGIYKEN